MAKASELLMRGHLMPKRTMKRWRAQKTLAPLRRDPQQAETGKAQHPLTGHEALTRAMAAFHPILTSWLTGTVHARMNVSRLLKTLPPMTGRQSSSPG